MIPHQFLIGGIALVFGALALGAAVANYEGMFQLAKLRMLEDTLGRNGARLACGLLGCSLIVVGGLILTGVLPRRTSQNEKQRAIEKLRSYPTAIA
jgi:hypothetical protein